MKSSQEPLPAGLIFVATPIGAARDITLRALDVLAGADVLAAEDTRTLRKLMEIHGVDLRGRPLVALHDHSGGGVISRLVRSVSEGKSVAYVSEAGTPLISDPGYELGRSVAEAGGAVSAAPGASAVLAALAVSGLPTDRFAFVGFLPAAKSARQRDLIALKDLPMTLVIYESPRRIRELFSDLCELYENMRQVALCRELTKRFEEVRRGTLAEVAATLDDDPPRGECVVVLGRPVGDTVSADDLRAALRKALGQMRVKDAATAVAGAYGRPRKEIYQMALALQKEGEG